MSLKNTLLTITAVVLAVAFAGYIFYSELNKTEADPFLFVPENSAIMLQLDQPGYVFGKMLADSTIWKSLTQVPVFNNIESDILQLGTFLNVKTAYFDQLKTSPLIVSFHPDKDYQTTQILLLSDLGDIPYRKDIQTFLENNLEPGFILSEYNGDDFKGFQITTAEMDQSFYFVFNDGIMIASSEKQIIEQAINTYEQQQPHFSQSLDFIKLKSTSGNKVDARLFIQYKQLGNLFKSFSNEVYFDAMDWLNNFAGWTVTDLFLKNNKLLFSGFTNYVQSENCFLNDFTNQSSSENRSINFLPFNTNIMLWQGFSDFSAFYDVQIKAKNSESDRLYSGKLSQFIGSEVTLASNASNEKEFEESTWAIVNLQNKKEAQKAFNNFAKKGNGKTVKFEDYTIRQIKQKNLLPTLFGKMFSVIKNNYYVYVGDYIVFANSTNSLINLLQAYKTGKTLDLSEQYKLFSDNLSSSANISFYINPAGLAKLLPKFLNDETATSFMKNAEVINRFTGLAFQFSSSESSLFYSNFYLNHSASKRSDNISQWKISLTDKIAGQPHLVKDHSTNKYNVIIFDINANMYLISTDGVILWKKRIDKLPISEIYEVDFFKNGKIQYLFNTADFIYLIDKNGEMVKDFPRKLNPSATNGLGLFDYNNKRDYRLLISQADKWTYNYTLKGNQVKGWGKPRMNYPVYEPISRLLIKKKDYLIITDERNNVKIVNRKGEERITLKENPNKAANSGYYRNKTNNKGIILTTNESGKLVYFSKNGRLKQTDFGDFSSKHFFLYEDFNGDGSIDFIYLDKNELKVFDRMKKEIFSYHFKSEIKIKPVFFRIGKNQKVLGIVADAEKTIYLFDNKGNITINKGLVGETPFVVGSLNNNREINLITAAGNVLYNYRLN